MIGGVIRIVLGLGLIVVGASTDGKGWAVLWTYLLAGLLISSGLKHIDEAES